MRSGRSRDQRPRFPPPSLGGRPAPVLALDDAVVREPHAHLLRGRVCVTACPVHGCYPDYFAATGSIAIDGTGHLFA
jgi:hypothetical protein